MKTYSILDGQITITKTDILMMMYTSKDNQIYMATCSNVKLYDCINVNNISIENDNIVLINEKINIPMFKTYDGDFIKTLLHQFEIMKNEIIYMKQCVNETVRVYAILSCDSIPMLNKQIKFINTNDNNVTTNNDMTIICINNFIKFNSSMIHVICNDIIFDKSINQDIYWNNLPQTVNSVQINNDKTFQSFLNNVKNMNVLFKNIHINDVKLTTQKLDILMQYNPNINIFHNDKLIKYMRVCIDEN